MALILGCLFIKLFMWVKSNIEAKSANLTAARGYCNTTVVDSDDGLRNDVKVGIFDRNVKCARLITGSYTVLVA
jgi:hypothetical protein